MADTKCSKGKPLGELLQEIDLTVGAASCVAAAIEKLAMEVIAKFNDDLELEPYAVAIRSMAREIGGNLDDVGPLLKGARAAEVANV